MNCIRQRAQLWLTGWEPSPSDDTCASSPRVGEMGRSPSGPRGTSGGMFRLVRWGIRWIASGKSHCLGGLDVVEDVLTSLSLLTPRAHNDARAANNLHGLSLSVEASKSSPLSKSLVILHLDQGDGICKNTSGKEKRTQRTKNSRGERGARRGVHASIAVRLIARLCRLCTDAPCTAR